MNRSEHKTKADALLARLTATYDHELRSLPLNERIRSWRSEVQRLSNISAWGGVSNAELTVFHKRAAMLTKELFPNARLRVLSAGKYVEIRVSATMTYTPSGTNGPEVKCNRPPIQAAYLLRLFLAKTEREHIPGDLEEEFNTIMVPNFGVRAAKLWYWKQVITSVAPVFRSRLGKWIAIAWFGKVAAWLTSKLGS